MKETIFVISILVIIIIISILLVAGIEITLTAININRGPYKCIDLDNNEIICEQTWRTHGTLYGITEEGKHINLKSFETLDKK